MRLYVGNLPYAYSEDDLRKVFSDFNVSSVRLIMDNETGRSKGFGFVDIENDEEAQRAIKTLDKKESGGKVLVVNEARPPQKRESHGGGGGGFRRDRDSREGGRPFNKSPRSKFGRA